MKNTFITIIGLALLLGGLYFLVIYERNEDPAFDRGDNGKLSGKATPDSETELPTTDKATDTTDVSAKTTDTTNEQLPKEVIGSSADGNDITAYHYGTGETELLFVGGMHGGYSWNTVLVARELMAHLDANPSLVPENIKVTVIPLLNPDGLKKVAGTTGPFTSADITGDTTSGRFNGNTVDLNRNFDCDWKETGTWQKQKVSGGTSAFSEPESAALKSYIDSHDITAAVVWYSAAGGVYASSCHNGTSAETQELTQEYALASGYAAHKEFDFYEITGDAVNWLAKKSIPAISVLLTTHDDVEWTKNRAGVEAIIDYYTP